MNRLTALAATVVALLAALTLTPSAADAATPDQPTRTCPGTTPNDAWAHAAMFCSVEKIAKPGAPYYVNYVSDEGTEQQFCQTRHAGTSESTECHPYWPFVNPTVNAYLAPASSFTSARLVADDATVRMLWRTTDRQERKIDRQARRIERLRHRLAALR